MTEPTLVSLKKIQANPYQPRTAEDEAVIAEIAINIFRNGLLQIPSARAVNGHYELVFGHTRKAAYEMLATKGVPTAEIPADKRFAEMPLYIHDLDNKQMFEMAVAENIKRRDLNAIETATAMQTYMNDFEATSKQAAELFGVNDATVRGKVRLLDLPEEVQSKLASGEMSEGTARTLLSVQRITSGKTVLDVAKKLEKTAGNELPEETIEDFLEQKSSRVVTMWDEGRGSGKPRADQRVKLWPLDMADFPNVRLVLIDPLTVDDVASALDVKDSPKKVKAIKQILLNSFVPGMDISFWKTPEYGSFTDDEIEKFKHLFSPPACTSCPFYTKLRGIHYCGMKLCHTRKSQVWAQEMFYEANRRLKIETYNSGRDGRYQILESYGREEKLFTNRDKNIRLIKRTDVKQQYAYQSFNGCDDDFFLVVATGAALTAINQKSNNSNTQTPADRIESRAKRLYFNKRKEIMWEFTLSAKHLFDAVTYSMLKMLDRWDYLGVDDQPPVNEIVEKNGNKDLGVKAEYIRRLLVFKMANKDTYSESDKRHSLIVVTTRLAGLAKEWGVAFPKRLIKQAEQGDLEVAAFIKELNAKAKARVAAETDKKK